MTRRPPIDLRRRRLGARGVRDRDIRYREEDVLNEEFSLGPAPADQTPSGARTPRRSQGSATVPRRPARGGAASPTPISDDRLLAELPARVSQVLLAAKVAADEIVSRAMERADLLEQQAHEQRQAAIQETRSLTRETVGRARRKAQALTDDARRKSEKMLADARAERDATLADLATRRAVLEGELQWAETKLLELQATSSAIAGMVGELFGRFADNPTTAARASSQLSRLRTAVQRRLREVS